LFVLNVGTDFGEKSPDRTSYLLLEADEDLGICKHSLEDFALFSSPKLTKVISSQNYFLKKNREKLLGKKILILVFER